MTDDCQKLLPRCSGGSVVDNDVSTIAVSIDNFLKEFGLSSESADRIRLGRGVVGKTTWAVGITLIVLGVVAARLGNQWLLIAVAGIAAVVFIVYFVGAIRFADKHPAEALLEGAELLRWKQYEVAAKGLTALQGPSVSPTEAIPGPVIDVPAPDTEKDEE